MAKAQKTFQLPPDVHKWLLDMEYRTGVSLSRIALVAFCMLKSEPDRTYWYQAAVAVDKGDITFDEVPAFVTRRLRQFQNVGERMILRGFAARLKTRGYTEQQVEQIIEAYAPSPPDKSLWKQAKSGERFPIESEQETIAAIRAERAAKAAEAAMESPQETPPPAEPPPPAKPKRRKPKP
jgi:hypothetical protein